jgi:hypothetical protein
MVIERRSCVIVLTIVSMTEPSGSSATISLLEPSARNSAIPGISQAS